MAALRRVLSSQAGYSLAASSRLRFFSSAPKVADLIVNLTVVDPDGDRHKVKGRVGQTLLKAMLQSHVDDPERHGYGADNIGSCNGNDEVTIPNEWLDKLPPPSEQELAVLKSASSTGSVNQHSRLGSQIVLSKGLDGMTVAMIQPRPYYTL